jgi:uncharacterized protein (DUF1499 family)
MKSRLLRRALALFAICVVAVPISLSVMNPSNIAQTSPQSSDTTLQTRVYAVSMVEIEAMLRQLVPSLRTYGGRWRLISTEKHEDKVIVKCEVPVLVFTDDLVVTLSPVQEPNTSTPRTQVDVRSASRVGRSDLGENRRHIRQLLYQLDATLNSAK